MDLVLVPPGEFLMGCSPEMLEATLTWADRVRQLAPGTERRRIQDEERPQHRVVITRPFELGRTEVTIGQYRRFVEQTGYVSETEKFGGGNSALTDEKDSRKKTAVWKTPGYQVTDNSPVTQITWNDCVVFCNWLSGEENLPASYTVQVDATYKLVPSGVGYRLPTEAEWEFACRAGATGQYSFGNDAAQLPEYAWFDKNADHVGAGKVASKLPNAFGLFDMHGNAWERCQDWFAADWYSRSPLADPAGPIEGARRIARGGAWHYFDLHCRCSYRNNSSPIGRTGNIGFRVARTITVKQD